MALYQASVLKKYLKQQDQETVQKAYKKYAKYFLNPTIQDNIRTSKEEQFQATFLTELFVNILGYTLKTLTLIWLRSLKIKKTLVKQMVRFSRTILLLQS